MIIQAESKRVILLNFLKMFYESGTPRGGKTGENSKQDLNNWATKSLELHIMGLFAAVVRVIWSFKNARFYTGVIRDESN